MAGIQEAAVSDEWNASVNSTNNTPKDLSVPGINMFTKVLPRSTSQPHPPSGGTST